MLTSTVNTNDARSVSVPGAFCFVRFLLYLLVIVWFGVNYQAQENIM